MNQLPKRAQELVDQLELIPHPEGGFYKETYRSELTLEGTERQLMTSIFFLLTGTNCSRFHKITSDEAWYFHEGNSLIVHTLDQNGYTPIHLGLNLEAGEQPFHLVKGGVVFGSSVKNDEGYALVSCAVAPGFDFNDFVLYDFETLIELYPNHLDIIRKLT